MNPLPNRNRDGEDAGDDSIDRREALAGVSLIGVLGVALVGSIVYRAMDASRAQRPVVRSQEISAPLLATNKPLVSGVEPLASQTSARSPDGELPVVDVDSFSSPHAELEAGWISDQRVSTSADQRDDPPRRDGEIVGASHEQRSASSHRPRFVPPGGVHGEDRSTPVEKQDRAIGE